MDIIETIKSLKQQDSDLNSTTIEYIQNELGSLYHDFAKIHLRSAERAFISATISNNPEVESRVGIGHLRDAFYAYQVYLEKGIKNGDSYWFGLWKIPWGLGQITSIELKMASIAFVIALIYERLNDEGNYITWKNNGLKLSNHYLQNRKEGISNWENAWTTPDTPTLYDKAIRVPDKELRQKYQDEIKFIKSFTEIVNVV